MLAHEFRQRKVKVPVTNYLPGYKRKDSKLNLAEMPKYGFVGYLDELFEAPSTIKAVLNDNSNLDTIVWCYVSCNHFISWLEAIKQSSTSKKLSTVLKSDTFSHQKTGTVKYVLNMAENWCQREWTS